MPSVVNVEDDTLPGSCALVDGLGTTRVGVGVREEGGGR